MRIHCTLYFLMIIALFFSGPVHAQRRITYSANTMEFAKSISPDAQRLIGNVKFTERTATMYCDSAYSYQSTENIDAYGNIRIYPDNSGTILTGKLLHYDAAL